MMNDEEDYKNFYRYIVMYILYIYYIYVRFVIKLYVFMYKYVCNIIF